MQCWDQNQSFMHFGHVRFSVQNRSYFKTKKLKTTHKCWLCAGPQRCVAAQSPLATVPCMCLHSWDTPSSLWPLQLPCASPSTASLFLFMWRSHGIGSGPGKLTALQPGLYRSWWVCKLFIYCIKERKEPQAIPLMVCMERECGRLQSDDSETLDAAIISLKQHELTKQIKQRVSSRG